MQQSKIDEILNQVDQIETDSYLQAKHTEAQNIRALQESIQSKKRRILELLKEQ